MVFALGRRRSLRCVALLLPLLLVATGCGTRKSKVSGRVLYKGAPLPGGQLLFRPADPKQNSVSAELDAEGNYEAVLPVGAVKVSVDNRQFEPAKDLSVGLPANLPFSPEAQKALKGKPDPVVPAPSGENAPPGKPAGKYIKIPSRYYDSEKSGLEFTVESGGMKHDIELSP
jgi:hypothetical protein